MLGVTEYPGRCRQLFQVFLWLRKRSRRHCWRRLPNPLDHTSTIKNSGRFAWINLLIPTVSSSNKAIGLVMWNVWRNAEGSIHWVFKTNEFPKCMNRWQNLGIFRPTAAESPVWNYPSRSCWFFQFNEGTDSTFIWCLNPWWIRLIPFGHAMWNFFLSK